MLVSLADMKTYLGISSGDTSQDAFLTTQLNLVSDTVEAYCRRIFSQTTYTQTFYRDEHPASRVLETYMFPLVSVTSITEDTDAALSSTLYRINKPTGIISRLNDAFFYCAEQTVVVYSAGYATIPTPIQSVVMTLVAERYNKKTSGVDLNFGSDVQRISIPGSISIDFDYSLSNNDRKTAFGVILGSQINVLDYYRSERAIIGSDKLVYIV